MFKLKAITKLSILFSSLLLTGVVATPPLVAQVNPVISSSQQKELRGKELDELLQQGQEYVDSEEYQRALSVYQYAASLEKQNSKIFSGIGYIQALLGNYAEAAQDYQKAIAL